jgi:hypothetical protein
MLRGDHEKEERKKSFRLAASADLMRAIRASETALCDRYPAAEKVSTSRCVRYFWLTIGIGLAYNYPLRSKDSCRKDDPPIEHASAIKCRFVWPLRKR